MIKDEQLGTLSKTITDIVIDWAKENEIEPTAENIMQVGAVFMLNSIDYLSSSKFGEKDISKEEIDELKSIILEAVDVYFGKELMPANVVLH